MSLICPMNSSRSNQSAQPRPAIWSRAESRRDPGRIAHKAPPGGGGGGGGGAVAAAARSGLLSSRSARSLADTREDINGREPLHQPTWPLLERVPPGRRPRRTQGGEERPSGEQPQHLVGISELGGAWDWETPPPRSLCTPASLLSFSLSLSPSLTPPSPSLSLLLSQIWFIFMLMFIFQGQSKYLALPVYTLSALRVYTCTHARTFIVTEDQALGGSALVSWLFLVLLFCLGRGSPVQESRVAGSLEAAPVMGGPGSSSWLASAPETKVLGR